MHRVQRQLNWHYRRLRRRLARPVYGMLYRDSDRRTDNCVLVAGAARSGTTWLGEIIASQIPCRVLFEPFHPGKVTGYSRFHYFQYMPPQEEDPALLSFCRSVFTGAIRNAWVDREVTCLNPRYRLVKEIRGNLLLRWISVRFPEIPLLFLVRHPCAVVASRLKLGWATDGDIDSFLAQPRLVEDFLADKMDTIRQAATEAEKHALIWCISNLVPLHQFASVGLHLVFYEHLILDPEREIQRLSERLGHGFGASARISMAEPSTTSLPGSAAVTGGDPIGRWQEDLSDSQIDQVLTIVRRFGLDHLYGDSLQPLGEPHQAPPGECPTARQDGEC